MSELPVFHTDDEFFVHDGDCIPHMAEVMEPASVDMTVFSPPFPSMYAYTSEDCDIGNTDTVNAEAEIHLSFFYQALRRVLKPGRVALVHVCQIPRMKRTGGVGMCDFRGLNIRIGERAGLVYEFDWLIPKNPQSQAIRTRSRELQFSGLEADRAAQRGAIPDYLIKFRAPGENAKPINAKGQVSRNQWIDWAESAWYGIKETNTLNTAKAKGPEDTKHICLAKGSLVLTRRDGHKPIEEIQIGDEVLTHKGRWRPVIAKKKTAASADVVSVRAQGVASLVLTPTHRVWAKDGKGTAKPKTAAMKAEPDWVEAAQLEGCYVNLKLPETETNAASTEDWWIVGRWLADGHWDKRGALIFSIGDDKRDAFCKTMGDRIGKGTKLTAWQYRLRDPHRKIRDIVDRCGKLAHGKHLPPEAFTLPPEQAGALMAGYLSGDGHFNEKRNRWSAPSVSRELLLGFKFLVQRVYGQVASIHPGRKARTTTIEGRTVNCRDEWVLSWGGVQFSHSFIADDGAWKKVKDVTDAGTAETWNIRVLEDESYTAEGCIVKNCPLQLDVIKRAVLLFSDPGEIVFSPFTGIGSEGYVALQYERRFYGCEIKPEYHREALRNLRSVTENRESQATLF